MAVAPLTIGRVLGHYRILEQIGAGGMGVVYRACDERLDRDVAVKVLPPDALADEKARRRLRKEALALAKLNHPNIATIHDFDTQEEINFLVMEYVKGVTLAEKLAKGSLPEKCVLILGEQIAKTLKDAHEVGVVHRDLKPGNVMVTTKGQVKLLDFGLARLLKGSETVATESLTEGHEVVGTLPYMAPEQLRGEPPDFRSDIYAAGTILYEMATGKRPFDEKLSSALIDDIIHKRPPPPRRFNPVLSSRLEDIVLKCLEKEPENRYQSAAELDVDLRRLQSPGDVPTTPPVSELRIRLRHFLIMSGIGVLSLLVLLLGLNVGGWRDRLLGRTRPDKIRSLAVLPLDNFSHDPEQDYFADGMTEELITELAQIRALRVISRTSTMQYKGTHKSVPEIARELRVDAILEGSVLRSGDRVRITAQLVEGSVDRHLWAKSFDRDLRDVLSLQGEVARNIADEIQVTLNPGEQARLAQSRPIDPAAHEAYLKGRYNWNKFTDEGMQKAVGYFQQAIAVDPSYAVAYVGLADAYHEIGVEMMAPAEAMRMAKAAAMKALELDPSLSDAHATLGWIKWRWDWDWSGAEQEFKKAIALDPNNSKGPAMYADFLDSAGRFDDAMLQHRRAVELDPLSLISNSNIGDSLFSARRYDEAIRQYKKTLEIDPGFAEAHLGLAGAYEHKGMYKEAVSELQQGMALNGDKDSATVARAFATSGWKGVLQSQLQSFKVRRAHGYFPPSEIAAIYADLGENDLALLWLKRAYEERDGGIVSLNRDPVWDALRSDSRFQDLMRKVGLLPEPASHANK